MSGVLRVSAPGKLILLGEYAVLDGAPAVVAAVDRRARVSASPASGPAWQVSAPGLKDLPAAFEVQPGGGVRWSTPDGGGGLELVEKLFAGWCEATGRVLEELPPLALELDTTEFFADAAGERRKVGLGSSAALTVALATVLAASYRGGGLPDRDLEWLQRLVSLHRSVQGGRGSGIDVAASLLGGVLEYRLDDQQRVAAVRRLPLPEGLYWLAVWTGRAAATGVFLEHLEAARATRSEQVGGAMATLGGAAGAGVAALRAVDVGRFLDAVDLAWAGLEGLGAAIGMPILSAEHRRLRELAAGCGVHYKPSGAGGGDLGLAFADDAGRLDLLAERAAAAGFRLPGLGIDPDGPLETGM